FWSPSKARITRHLENNQVHLESKERGLFSEKRKSRQPTLQRTEPEPLSNLSREPEGPNEEPYCSLSFEKLCRKREVSLAFARNQSGTGKVASNRVLIQMEKGNQAYFNLEWET
uniref:Uncharacterized protein n=1 Tax=Sus scrofa TaxID=9823 RepID=A0A8D2A6W7_PIG